MKKIKIILILFILTLLVLCSSSCYSSFKSTIKLVNNYTDNIAFAFGIDNDYITCTGTDCELDEENDNFIISQLAPNNEWAYSWELKMNSYEIIDWAVWYEYQITDDATDWNYIELSPEINNDYQFNMQRVYTITVDEQLNLTIDVSSEAE